MFGTRQLFIALTATALVAGTSANAADLTWPGGSGTWETPNAWTGVTWTDGSGAILGGSQGTITLGSDHALDLLTINGNTGSATDYVVGNTPGNQTLTFSGTNAVTINGVDAVINTGVAGTPTLVYNSRSNNSALLTLNTGSLTQNYASTTVNKGVFGSQTNAGMILDGTSTGNSTGNLSWSEFGAGHQLFIQKQGTGTWEIGSFTSGRARVRNIGAGGTLVVNGDLIVSHEIDAEAGTLVANGILSVTRGGVEHVRVFAGASFQPGISGIDTVTIQNDHLTWNSDDATAGMLFDLSAADSTSDLIDITGSGSNAGSFLKGAGSSFLFDFTGGKAGETYTLVQFDATTFSVGDFAATGSSIAGSFTLNANNLQYTAVPEPSSLALLGLGGLMMIKRRRRG